MRIQGGPQKLVPSLSSHPLHRTQNTEHTSHQTGQDRLHENGTRRLCQGGEKAKQTKIDNPAPSSSSSSSRLPALRQRPAPSSSDDDDDGEDGDGGAAGSEQRNCCSSSVRRGYSLPTGRLGENRRPSSVSADVSDTILMGGEREAQCEMIPSAVLSSFFVRSLARKLHTLSHQIL